ncbi:Transcription repressor OFP13 [Linum grandiflorum]
MFQIKHRAKILNKLKSLLLFNTTKTIERDTSDVCDVLDDVDDIRSERLVFEAAGSTRSILEAAKVPFGDSVVVALESEDPLLDFRVSMEEMVEVIGLDGSEQLGELLEWYLRMNRKENHCYIVEAFVEMFTGSSFLVCPACTTSTGTSGTTTMRLETG